MERCDSQLLMETFIKINDIVNNLLDENQFYVHIEITTLDSVVRDIVLSNYDSKNIGITKNMIVYDNTAISLNDIVKVKILSDNSIKDELIVELKSINTSNSKYLYSNSYQRKYNKKINDKNIEEYIQENSENIDSIRLNTIIDVKNDSNRVDIKLNKEEVLSNQTSLDIKKIEVVDSVNISTQESEAINSIEMYPQDVIAKIDIEQKKVLTESAKEVEVSKPLKTKSINVITDIDIKDCNVVVNQCSTTAVKEMKQYKHDVVTDISTTYTKGVIGNINNKKQIIKPKTIDILCIEPLNEYVDKSEVNSKPLRLDPTGERYIGVVLDDGTFEPLKLIQKTITVLDEDVKNLLGNIEDENQISKVVEDVKSIKGDSLKSLDIEYIDNVAEYKSENLKDLKNIINSQKCIINSVTNQNDTVHVVTKEKTEEISDIKNIRQIPIQQIKDIKTVPVIKSAQIISDSKSVIEDVDLSKVDTEVVKDMKVENIKEDCLSKEKINGSIEYVGDGIMIVDNGDLDITIYSTSKINSVNL
ncbi:MAG: hypothetical protein ACRC3Y_13680 [Romboutsia sp.]|uniref:hypothetical protein n=1 Tax=Romboutsia sp. TaxID=1965302 RepID=UPI003F3F0CAD